MVAVLPSFVVETSFIDKDGGASPSAIIVIVTFCVPSSFAEDPVASIVSISIIAVSLPSYVLSSVGVKFTVPVVSPAEITISLILPLPSV